MNYRRLTSAVVHAEPKAVQPCVSHARHRALYSAAELMLFATNGIWQLLFERPHQHDAHHRYAEH